MTNPKDSQWRATPAFNTAYANLVDCVAAAIKHFLRRRSIIFVMLYCVRRNVWYLMPWSQYRHLPTDHEGATAATVFRGTFDQLRSIAHSFPPDMFAETPSDDCLDVTTETPSAPDGAVKPEFDHRAYGQTIDKKPKDKNADPAAPPSVGDSATSVKDPEP